MTDDAPPTLLSLPPDMLRHVLGFLGVRSLLSAAATCTTLRQLADQRELHPVLTAHFSLSRALDWMALPHVRGRVRTLTARRCLWGRCCFLRNLESLQRLVVLYTRVTAPLFRHVPTTLQHLTLHRLESDWGSGVFSTSNVSRLTQLRTLEITFTPTWDLVVVEGLAHLPLRRLSLRLAPALVVHHELRIDSVLLHGVSALVCPFPVHARDLHLECGERLAPLDLVVTPESAGQLRSLYLSCPRRMTIPSAEELTGLQRLHLCYDAAVVSLRHLAAMRDLRCVELETRFGVAVAGMRVSLPRAVKVRASVGGVPLSQTVVDAMFHRAQA